MNGARGRDDDHDVYDGPRSPAKRLKPNSGPWRPWIGSQEKSAPRNEIRVSTPDRRTELFDPRESHQSAKQQATPRPKSIYLSLITDALTAKPDKPLSLEDILKWIRTNRSAVYQEYGTKKLRSAIQTSLNYQAKKVESKRTVWEYEGGSWQLHKPVIAATDDEESADTHTERLTTTPSMVFSSVGRNACDSTLESCESTSPSRLRETGERDFANSQNTAPATIPHTQGDGRLAPVESQPGRAYSEADARNATENRALSGAGATAPAVESLSPNRDRAPTQPEPAAGSISTTTHNEPSNVMETEAPANSCDDLKQYDPNEPDYAQIVRNLHLLKDKRIEQEQKIKDAQAVLPEISSLIQSANEAEHAAGEAQLAADEAQRVAEEAHRVADTTKKAVENAQAEKSQLVAHKHHLEKLKEEALALRAQLHID